MFAYKVNTEIKTKYGMTLPDIKKVTSIYYKHLKSLVLLLKYCVLGLGLNL